jgi:hypothetical protein
MMRHQGWVIFGAALAVRTFWGIFIQYTHPNGFLVYDSWGYLNIAHSWFHHGAYSQMTQAPFTPDASRTPLYPMLIYIFHLLQMGVFYIVLLQCMLSAATAWVWWKCIGTAGINILDPRLFILVSVLLVFDISSIILAATIGTETLFVFLLSLSLWCTLRWWSNRKIIALLGSAAFLSLAALCRPVALYLLMSMPVALLLLSDVPWRKLRWYVLTFLIVCGPWFVRNKAVFGTYFFSSISTVNLLFHTAAGVNAQANNSTRSSEEYIYRNELLGDLDFNNSEAIPVFIQRADSVFYSTVKSHPAIFATMWAKGIFYFFAKPLRSYIDVQTGYTEEYSSDFSIEKSFFRSMATISSTKSSQTVTVAVLWQILWLLAVYTGCFIFLIKIKKHSLMLVLIGGWVLFFACISGLTESDARLRMPVHGMLIILAISGIAGYIRHKTPAVEHQI